MSGSKAVRTWRDRLVPLGVVLVSTLIALLLGEVIVRFVVNPGDFLKAEDVKDEILGIRINPYTPGHDALGFRNPEVPRHAGIVAVGDSQTYGVGVARKDSWPYQLGVLLGKPVYNMGLGGYCPLEYLYLVQHQAKRLQPQLLLVGFSFGTDLIESYHAVHRRPYWHEWRESESAERAGDESERNDSAEPTKAFAGLRDWLARHSVVYSMLRVSLLPALSLVEKDSRAEKVSPDVRMIWTDPSSPSIRTIFTPQLRLAVEDLRDPRIGEGLRITKRAFGEIKKEASGQGAKLLVVLLPTKERVYCHYLKHTDIRLPERFVNLCDAERQVKDDLIAFLRTQGISHVDVTEALEAQVEEHLQIYRKDDDGHPASLGYSVIASVVRDELRRQHWVQ